MDLGSQIGFVMQKSYSNVHQSFHDDKSWYAGVMTFKHVLTRSCVPHVLLCCHPQPVPRIGLPMRAPLHVASQWIAVWWCWAFGVVVYGYPCTPALISNSNVCTPRVPHDIYKRANFSKWSAIILLCLIAAVVKHFASQVDWQRVW